MMSLWDALRMNMMISYQELVRTFPKEPYILILLFSLLVVGLSDVILFSKPVPTAVFVTIILLCAYFKAQSDQCLLDK